MVSWYARNSLMPSRTKSMSQNGSSEPVSKEKAPPHRSYLKQTPGDINLQGSFQSQSCGRSVLDNGGSHGELECSIDLPLHGSARVEMSQISELTDNRSYNTINRSQQRQKFHIGDAWKSSQHKACDNSNLPDSVPKKNCSEMTSNGDFYSNRKSQRSVSSVVSDFQASMLNWRPVLRNTCNIQLSKSQKSVPSRRPIFHNGSGDCPVTENSNIKEQSRSVRPNLSSHFAGIGNRRIESPHNTDFQIKVGATSSGANYSDAHTVQPPKALKQPAFVDDKNGCTAQRWQQASTQARFQCTSNSRTPFPGHADADRTLHQHDERDGAWYSRSAILEETNIKERDLNAKTADLDKKLYSFHLSLASAEGEHKEWNKKLDQSFQEQQKKNISNMQCLYNDFIVKFEHAAAKKMECHVKHVSNFEEIIAQSDVKHEANMKNLSLQYKAVEKKLSNVSSMLNDAKKAVSKVNALVSSSIASIVNARDEMIQSSCALIKNRVFDIANGVLHELIPRDTHGSTWNQEAHVIIDMYTPTTVESHDNEAGILVAQTGNLERTPVRTSKRKIDEVVLPRRRSLNKRKAMGMVCNDSKKEQMGENRIPSSIVIDIPTTAESKGRETVVQMVAHENLNQTPPRTFQRRTDEVILPRRVRVHKHKELEMTSNDASTKKIAKRTFPEPVQMITGNSVRQSKTCLIPFDQIELSRPLQKHSGRPRRRKFGNTRELIDVTDHEFSFL